MTISVEIINSKTKGTIYLGADARIKPVPPHEIKKRIRGVNTEIQPDDEIKFEENYLLKMASGRSFWYYVVSKTGQGK